MAPSEQDTSDVLGSSPLRPHLVSCSVKMAPSPKELWDPCPPHSYTPPSSVLVGGTGSGARMLGSNMPFTSPLNDLSQVT